MSPITATLKCPHGTGKDTIESEAVAEVASHKDGGGREDQKVWVKGMEKRYGVKSLQADRE